MRYIKDQHGDLNLEFVDRPLKKGEEIFYDTRPAGGNAQTETNIGGHADIHFNEDGAPEGVVKGGLLQSPAEAKLYRDAKDLNYKVKVPKGKCKFCKAMFDRETTRQKYCCEKCKRRAQNMAAKLKRERTK